LQTFLWIYPGSSFGSAQCTAIRLIIDMSQTFEKFQRFHSSNLFFKKEFACKSPKLVFQELNLPTSAELIRLNKNPKLHYRSKFSLVFNQIEVSDRI
jgi:hypothetical protein